MEQKMQFSNMFDKNISFKWVTFKCLFYVKRCKYANNQKGPTNFYFFLRTFLKVHAKFPLMHHNSIIEMRVKDIFNLL